MPKLASSETRAKVGDLGGLELINRGQWGTRRGELRKCLGGVPAGSRPGWLQGIGEQEVSGRCEVLIDGKGEGLVGLQICRRL